MDCRKKLSIIIPVYNTEKYVEKCIESVVSAVQGIEDEVEVLVINDGSTDSSPDILSKYEQLYNKWLKVYTKENGGLSDVKNYGLKKAIGDYVIFLDSDDYIEPQMYKDMLHVVNEEKADVVVCDIKLVYDDENKNAIYPCAIKAREEIFAQVIDMPMMPASWNKMVKKELYAGLDFPVGLNNEDVAVTPIVLARAKKICVVEKPYYNYYQRVGSIQNSGFNEKRFVILDTAKILMDRLKEISGTKVELIKGSIYLHQILAIALYPIREEKMPQRYIYLRKYMKKVDIDFVDIWDNSEVQESLNWDGRYMQMFRRISYFLMENHMYCLTSIFWSCCNIINYFRKRYAHSKKNG